MAEAAAVGVVAVGGGGCRLLRTSPRRPLRWAGAVDYARVVAAA